MYDFLTDKILQNYADLMVNFAANERKGINKNDVCYVRVPESASIILKYFQRSILKAGGHPVLEISPEGLAADFYKMATSHPTLPVKQELLHCGQDKFYAK